MISAGLYYTVIVNRNKTRGLPLTFIDAPTKEAIQAALEIEIKDLQRSYEESGDETEDWEYDDIRDCIEARQHDLEAVRHISELQLPTDDGTKTSRDLKIAGVKIATVEITANRVYKKAA
jgi:hypothetical protein